jgi:hypothetical protein
LELRSSRPRLDASDEEASMAARRRPRRKPARQECRGHQDHPGGNQYYPGFKLSGFTFEVRVDGRVGPLDPANRMT